MNAEQKLLPCPFCGGAPDAAFESPGVPGMEDCGYYYIQCCDVHVHRDTEAEAIAAWNTRALQQRPSNAIPSSQRYTVERHGDGWAIYLGRDAQHHGLNIGHLTECSAVLAKKIESALNGEAMPR